MSTLTTLQTRFKTNATGYVRAFWPFLLLTLLAGLADMYSTIQFMQLIGPEHEVHPAIRFVSVILGPIAGPVVGKCCQFAVIILLTIYFRNWARFLLSCLIILYLWAAWFNLYS